MDNFSVNETGRDILPSYSTFMNGVSKMPPMHMAPSPPASPTTSMYPGFRPSSSYAQQSAADPPLYPSTQEATARPSVPLFQSFEQSLHSDSNESTLHPVEDDQSVSSPEQETVTITQVKSKNTPHISSRSSPPAEADRQLVKEFARKMMHPYEKRPQEYYNDRMDELKLLAKLHRRQSSPTTTTSSAPKPKKQTTSPQFAGVAKKPRVKRTVKTPQVTSYTDVMAETYFTPAPESKPKRASPTKSISSRDDNKWQELPDFSPPTSTLTDTGRTLKATWKGQPLDLSADEDRGSCTKDEVTVASVLRLSCAQYLSTKRRIFQARFNCLKEGKNFSKTQAQLACKIDVNKASRLHEAFEKVGWFDEKHFRHFL